MDSTALFFQKLAQNDLDRFADLQLASSLAALNRVSTGVILFGGRGNVVYTNPMASEILSESASALVMRSGNPRTDGLGWLWATSDADNALLQRELATAVAKSVVVSHYAHGVPLHRATSMNPLLLQLSSLAPNNEYSHRDRAAVAIGFISDPDAPVRLDCSLLANSYRLTPAECALAQELLTGASVKKISGRLGVSPATTKTQLAAIFSKTGTHRQSELVKLLISFTAPTVRLRTDPREHHPNG